MYVMEPQVQVRNDCLLLYNLPTGHGPRARKLSLKKAYSGKVTKGGVQRIKKAIDILVQKTDPRIIWNPVTKKHFPFTLNFVTLTVSSRKNIDPRFGYSRLLEPFLRIMRNEGNFSYVWKAEFQKRGQVHYHLATNTFLTWQKIRSTWNNLQRKNRLLDEYAKKYGHFDPNSTDVHALGGIANLAAYLSKYLSKSNSQKISGKIWDCSKDCKGKRFAFTPTVDQEIYLMQLLENKQIKVVVLEHCTIVKGITAVNFMDSNQIIDYINWKS